jgi:thiol-disulfide isomerase/thioredoxin
VSPVVGAALLAAVMLAAGAFGLYRRRTDGRLRAQADERLGPDDIGSALGERATLVQFSSAFCQPCRATRQILSRVSADVSGVRHIEIDAESHLELVRRLDVRRTPTVFVLDSNGVIRQRASGAPRRADVVAALGRVVA